MKSVIVACDVSLELFEQILEETKDLEGIGGYKVGFKLGLQHGLPNVVRIARKITDKPIIYDHQKAGTDIPETNNDFMGTMSSSGVDQAILFPLAGPATEKAWIEAAKEHAVDVIVGGWMTHPQFAKSEGGFIDDDSVLEMYMVAAQAGVTRFVVPGTKPDKIRKIRELVVSEGIDRPEFYAPGLVTQGGNIAEAVDAAGGNLHVIIGRAVYQAENMREAAEKFIEQLG